MSDNLIPYPFRKNQGLSTNPASPERQEGLSPALISRWQQGLLSERYARQWQTFEEMAHFTDLRVMKLLEHFFLSDQGDWTLKTKILQTIRRTCPWPISFQVKKGENIQCVNIQDVPLSFEHWPEKVLRPCLTLEETSADNPSLVAMAKELWVYGLEKHYPFLPDFTNHLQWTAALHYYTLNVIDPELAGRSLERDLPQLYQLTTSVIQQQAEELTGWLMQL
ncbi:hypothetical protein GCM10010965_24170 [Caldalkalibacillus thermarum]|uniref:hypothetical protein n=1 Tax=Caldalkalibacillus thermarum TaxID=296745 RepID=UPI00166778BF|nr:hypothetical protein [Caldalkalibacillus thermarum]GGK30475.1 hypothetical protein GCM10010965_24170 [Caldalkalibacillus thermarum]